jgi:PhnB protein
MTYFMAHSGDIITTDRRFETMDSEMPNPGKPEGYATVNPFIISEDSAGLIEFLKEVFGATERPEARTMDHDGLLLHAELAVGDATVMFGERKPDWPFTPSLLQVYVDDVERTLEVARRLGATIITEPTDFFGDTFSRFRDPWGNLWWVYRHGGQPGTGDETEWADSDAEEWQQESPELTYIHETLVQAMAGLSDPRSAAR